MEFRTSTPLSKRDRTPSFFNVEDEDSANHTASLTADESNPALSNSLMSTDSLNPAKISKFSSDFSTFSSVTQLVYTLNHYTSSTQDFSGPDYGLSAVLVHLGLNCINFVIVIIAVSLMFNGPFF